MDRLAVPEQTAPLAGVAGLLGVGHALKRPEMLRVAKKRKDGHRSAATHKRIVGRFTMISSRSAGSVQSCGPTHHRGDRQRLTASRLSPLRCHALLPLAVAGTGREAVCPLPPPPPPPVCLPARPQTAVVGLAPRCARCCGIAAYGRPNTSVQTRLGHLHDDPGGHAVQDASPGLHRAGGSA